MGSHYCKFLSFPYSKVFCSALVICAGFLSACSSQAPHAVTPQQESAASQAPFGIWEIENCRVQSAKETAITLSTDGYLSNNTLNVRISSSKPLASAPRISLTSWPHQFRLFGSGTTFGTDVPYSPAVANRLHHPASFVKVEFLPENGIPETEIFSTNGLPNALAELSQRCR